MKSILSNEKRCFVCERTPVQQHHIFNGWANRKWSERYGCWCYLCLEHHTGKSGVHEEIELDLKLKRLCQAKFEETHSREEFRSIFGKSYL